MLQMEGAGLALPPLQGLQRQLADLQLTPAAGSRTANRRSRRTASRTKAASAAVPAKVSLVLGGGDAATAGEPRDCQSACASPRSSTTAGSTSSPRIQAAPAPHPQTAGDGAGGKADTQGQSSGKLCESKDIQVRKGARITAGFAAVSLQGAAPLPSGSAGWASCRGPTGSYWTGTG
jgi:hypothetical protein